MLMERYLFVNYAGVLTPHILQKACCENLGSGYTFNITLKHVAGVLIHSILVI
jgi:hypothetical protein